MMPCQTCRPPVLRTRCMILSFSCKAHAPVVFSAEHSRSRVCPLVNVPSSSSLHLDRSVLTIVAILVRSWIWQIGLHFLLPRVSSVHIVWHDHKDNLKLNYTEFRIFSDNYSRFIQFFVSLNIDNVCLRYICFACICMQLLRLLMSRRMQS